MNMDSFTFRMMYHPRLLTFAVRGETESPQKQERRRL